MQHLAIYGNLVLGHPLQPPVGFVSLTQPLPGGGWPFLLFRHPHSRIYTIILDATANQNGTHPEHHARHWSPAPSGEGRDNSDISQPTAHATAASRGIATAPR